MTNIKEATSKTPEVSGKTTQQKERKIYQIPSNIVWKGIPLLVHFLLIKSRFVYHIQKPLFTYRQLEVINLSVVILSGN